MAEYIEREYLLANFAVTDYPWSDFDDAWEMVQNAPSVDVAPVVHGSWEYIVTNKYGHVYQCSHCTGRIGLDYEMAYCPNCGAKMDLEDENDG